MGQSVVVVLFDEMLRDCLCIGHSAVHNIFMECMDWFCRNRNSWLVLGWSHLLHWKVCVYLWKLYLTCPLSLSFICLPYCCDFFCVSLIELCTTLLWFFSLSQESVCIFNWYLCMVFSYEYLKSWFFIIFYQTTFWDCLLCFFFLRRKGSRFTNDNLLHAQNGVFMGF